MRTARFFKEPREQSLIKARVVRKYFTAWSTIMIKKVKQGDGKIAYMDLFAGPGFYEDRTKSTPLHIIEDTIQNINLRTRLATIFNDNNKEYITSLEQEILNLPGIETLKYEPTFICEEVGEDIVKELDSVSLVPTLFFVDPYGYKGLSFDLFKAILKGWGCDCLFFFNYNRVNAGLENANVRDHMDMLFGEERANQLRENIIGQTKYEREKIIVEALKKALNDVGGTYVWPFCFKGDTGDRTSHYLILVTKDKTALKIYKDITGKESSFCEQGVPSFEFSPTKTHQMRLSELSPLEELERALLAEFAGRTLRVEQLFEAHHIDKSYIQKNYKDVLIKLELEGKISANPLSIDRPKRGNKITMASDVEVTFPCKRS